MKYLAAFLTILLFACAASSLKVFDSPGDQFEYAKKLYQDEKYDQAIEAFQTVIFRFHGTSLADSVTFYLGMCYFNQEEYILAVGEFRRLLTNYPTSPLADQAHYMVARSYFRDSPDNVGLEQDGVKKAIQTAENFLEDFPNSPYRPNARTLLDSCHARLAEKDFKNGMVYYKIGDKRAARIYFEGVVTNYSIPEWVGKSLYMLAEIDWNEEKFDDAKAKLNNMMNAFPDHEWYNKAKDKYEEVLAKIENEQQSSADERAQE
ncbi:MAG TPA: outer membrane protein assembly factor BamD [candidate division Zixibacteria bacterium]|nr:outer membrane protein assembly factor BamD [candidate division Zixibacteria bacterium]